jgi:putative transposase
MQTKSATNLHGHDLRRGRVSISGQIYLVTTVVKNRAPLFSDLHAGRIVVNALIYANNSGRALTLAYVVMPDHLHWLMSLGEQGSFSSVVSMMKRHTSRKINEQTGGTGKGIWQRGFHDHALRRDEDVARVARYVVANPLRAGLVQRIGDYPLWDAVWL